MNIKTYTASQARSDLYNLIRSAGKGLQSYEITLKNSDPVILISKSELESWMETLDILSNPEEVEAIREGMKSKKRISFKDALKELGLDEN